MIRVTHVTSSITALGGGIPVALQSLAKAQDRHGIITSVVGHFDGGTPLTGWPEGEPRALPVLRMPGMAWAPRMLAAISSGSPQLFHVHGLWSQASVLVARVARKTGTPYLVSPHGMLDPWALKNSGWKKKVAALLFEKRLLKGATCLHALCLSEARSIRQYGLKNPVCVIPNGVTLPDERPVLDGGKTGGGRKILLFLGRLHPKKGLVNALKAWAKAGLSKEWIFVIAGWDQNGHRRELTTLCEEQGLSFLEADSSPGSIWEAGHAPSDFEVVFTGPIFATERDQLFRSATAFILPSLSEGLPMTILEAWAHGLPVLMTDECNLPEGFTVNAAIRIGTDVENMIVGLRSLQGYPPDELEAIGSNGRALVQEKFEWNKVARQMTDVYQWILENGSKPAALIS